MHREPVASSVIASLGYDESSRTLEVEFTSGAVYRYYDVECLRWGQMLQAESKGVFLNTFIKDKYRFAKLR